MSTWSQGRPAVVVTGGTSGLGLATVEELLAQGSDVFAIGRNPDRCRQIEAELQSRFTPQVIRFIMCDLSATAAVRAGAREIRAALVEAGHVSIDALINNAATVSSWRIATPEGYEQQFAVNHLAAFLLTHELLPLLELGYPARVVVVASGSHRHGRIHWSDPMLTRGYSLLRAYEQTKLANVMFCEEFNRRYAHHSRVEAFAYDPGLMRTDIGMKSTGGLESAVWRMRTISRRAIDPSVSARALAHLSLANREELESHYMVLDRPGVAGRNARDPRDARRLWELSERLCSGEPSVAR